MRFMSPKFIKKPSDLNNRKASLNVTTVTSATQKDKLKRSIFKVKDP
jgi:hypothetical protein